MPIVGPLIVGVIGAVLYDLFVGDVLRARGAPPAPDVDAFGETVEDRPGGDGELEPHGRTVGDR